MSNKLRKMEVYFSQEEIGREYKQISDENQTFLGCGARRSALKQVVESEIFEEILKSLASHRMLKDGHGDQSKLTNLQSTHQQLRLIQTNNSECEWSESHRR